MSPDHKGMLIKELQQETGEMIGMWGDGANDWQALKASDAGLWLSNTGVSISAPFTSSVENISSSVDFLRLGRFSLDYSYWLIKYLIINCLIEFLETLILYLNTLGISSAQYTCIDILCLFPVGAILWFIDPISELPSYYPPGSLFDLEIILSIIGHIIITIFGAVGSYFWLKGQGFYIDITKGSELESGSLIFWLYLIRYIETQEVTTLVTFSLPLYIFIGIVYYSSSRFKESLFQFRFDYICIICKQLYSLYFCYH